MKSWREKEYIQKREHRKLDHSEPCGESVELPHSQLQEKLTSHHWNDFLSIAARCTAVGDDRQILDSTDGIQQIEKPHRANLVGSASTSNQETRRTMSCWSSVAICKRVRLIVMLLR